LPVAEEEYAGAPTTREVRLGLKARCWGIAEGRFQGLQILCRAAPDTAHRGGVYAAKQGGTTGSPVLQDEAIFALLSKDMK